MITQLTPDMHGKAIICELEGDIISDAKIVLEEGQYFIVQNHRNGYDCIDKLGYKCSWTVTDGTPYALETNSVTNIQLLNSDYEIY